MQILTLSAPMETRAPTAHGALEKFVGYNERRRHSQQEDYIECRDDVEQATRVRGPGNPVDGLSEEGEYAPHIIDRPVEEDIRLETVLDVEISQREPGEGGLADISWPPAHPGGIVRISEDERGEHEEGVDDGPYGPHLQRVCRAVRE